MGTVCGDLDSKYVGGYDGLCCDFLQSTVLDQQDCPFGHSLSVRYVQV